MMIEEITEKIIESKNNDIAKAFTLHICGLLLNNGIVPIMTEYTENDVENIEDTDEYKIVMEYGVAFKKLDCTEHDKKVYSKAIDDFAGRLKTELLIGLNSRIPSISLEDIYKIAEEMKGRR